jgi:hypothetical protein
MRTSILAFFSLLSSAWAVNVYGTIRWNNICPGPNALCCKCFRLTVYVTHRIRPTRSVKGDPGQWNLRWNRNSEWQFYDVSLSMLPYPDTEDCLRPDVSPGTYILSVVAHDFSFDQVGILVAIN